MPKTAENIDFVLYTQWNSYKTLKVNVTARLSNADIDSLRAMKCNVESKQRRLADSAGVTAFLKEPDRKSVV